jgi:DNA mismatch repair ATPase MutS
MVRNDVALTPQVRLLIVSGSNMSGKSTLLRTVGVNTVLAMAGAPVRAAALTLSPLAVGATLHVHDSLQAGRSRFFAEISRIRSVADLADPPPGSAATGLLFLLDELFQGTNSHDRKIGAQALLLSLLDRGAIGLTTTHDLALIAIADQSSGRAMNVHFEDVLKDGELTFDYTMKPGPVTHSNALALMKAVGLPVTTIDRRDN